MGNITEEKKKKYNSKYQKEYNQDPREKKEWDGHLRKYHKYDMQDRREYWI